VVFSSGIYGTIPKSVYNNIFASLAQNVSIINAPGPLNRRKFELLCDEYEQQKLPLIAHSSFDPDILESYRLEKALLFDPATLPLLSTSGLMSVTIQPRVPVNIVLSKFYDTFVKKAFQPKIEGAALMQLDYGGHSDLLDGMMPWVAQKIGIKSDTENIQEYKTFIKLCINEWVVSNQGG
jgi:hypothetical protein